MSALPRPISEIMVAYRAYFSFCLIFFSFSITYFQINLYDYCVNYCLYFFADGVGPNKDSSSCFFIGF